MKLNSMGLVVIINVAVIFYCSWLSKLNLRKFLLYWLIFLTINPSALLFFKLPVSTLKLRILLLTIIAIFLLYNILVRREINKFIHKIYDSNFLLIISFLSVLLIWLIIPEDKEYGTTKTLMFVSNSVLPSIILIMLAPYSRKDLDGIIKVIIVSSIILVALLLLNPVEVDGMRNRLSLDAFELHPNKLSRDICTGLLLLIISILFVPKKQSKKKRMAAIKFISLLLIILSMVFVSFRTGSRGPLAMVAAVIFIFIILRFNLRLLVPFFFKLLFIAMITGIAVKYTNFDELAGEQLERIISLFERAGENKSDESRLSRQIVALNAFVKSGGLGIGTGGFYETWQGPPPGGINSKRDYPHNIFIETISEQGVLGVLLLFYLTWLSLKIFVMLQKNKGHGSPPPELIVLYSLWLYGFANAQISGDIGTNYLVWLGATLVFLARKPFFSQTKTHNITL